MSELPDVPHIPRIRCRRCGRRVHTNITVCPNCGHDPRAFAFPGWLTVVILFALGVGLAILLWYNARLIFLAVDKQPTLIPAQPTPSVTWTPRVNVIVVTETRIPSPIASPTDKPLPSPTATITPTLTTTATRPRPNPTRTNTPLPAPVLLAAPAVFTPDTDEKFYGPRKQIIISWDVPNNLPTSQWYRVRVEFRHRELGDYAWCTWTRDGQLLFPFVHYEEASAADRTFRWTVQLMQPVITDPRDLGCDVPATPISAPSAPRTFFWY